MTSGFGRILISYAPDSAAHVDAVRDLWVVLRAAGLDANLLPASAEPAGSGPAGSGPAGPAPDSVDPDSADPDIAEADLDTAELDSADVVLLVGSPLYRDVAAGAGPGRWRTIHAIGDRVAGDEKFAAAVLPVVLPGTSVDDLPAFLAAHPGPRHRLRGLGGRGVAALVEELHGRCGSMGPAPRHELRLDVSVVQSRVRATATLAGTVLCRRDEPLPFGRDEVWSLLDLPDAEARLARLGQRLSAALFDTDSLDQLTTLVTAAVDGTVIDVVVDADGPAHELPFELIRLTDQRVLATVDGVRFTRTVAGVPALAHPPRPGPLKILVAVGAPERTDNPPLDVEAELQAIVDVVGGLGRAEITILEVAGPQEIAEALRRDAYHVLHLSAHGSPYGVELADRDGNAVDVQAADLVRVLRRGGRPLPLIVLSSCGGAADADTGLATTLLRHGADRVIAMQTTVSDPYATGLLSRVYRRLAEENPPVAAALATARAELFEEAVRAGTPSRPEYAVPTLFAASDGPLWDAAAPPVPLSNPTELPTGAGVRELLLGELIGRRAQLRVVSQTLRDETPATGESALVNGVVLTGVAGIGKTALAGRAVNRLRDDVDDPWSIVVHTGVWNPPRLVEDVAATEAGAEVRDHSDQAAALAAITNALRTRRLLIVFDDFEQNLTVGGADFHDPGFAEIFEELCRAAERGKILVTSRHLPPGELPLLHVGVPPLSDAEVRRLLLRLPAVRALSPDDRETVVRAVGGHPRLLEFVDALLHGDAGRARLPEVTERLRRLTGPAGTPDAAPARQAPTAAKAPAPEAGTVAAPGTDGREADAPDPAGATRRAIALAARDMLLAELLDLLTPAERETLHQAAVSRVPVTADDLAFALLEREPTGEDREAVAAHLRRLSGLTLVTSNPAGAPGSRNAGEDGVLVEPWLRDALAEPHGERRLDRHRRAAAMCDRIVESDRGDFATLTEAVHHLRVTGRFDELAAFAGRVLPRLAEELAVAAFLGEVTPDFPADHPAYLGLLARERDALEATGGTAAAAVKGEEVVALVAARAEAVPEEIEAQLALSAALDTQARLMHRLGRLDPADDLYAWALTIDLRLHDADPGDARLRRNVGLSYQKIAQLALDRDEPERAREAARRSLRIREELAATDPDDPAAQCDLAAGLATLAAVCRAADDDGTARELLDRALLVWRRVVPDDATDANLLSGLLDCVNALADVIGLDGDEAEQAGRLILEAGSLAERLTAADSSDIAAQRKLLAAYWRLADMDLAGGDPACAGQHVEAGLSLAQRLADTDPDSVDGLRDLSTAFRRVAEHALANGQPEEVRGNLERSLEITEGLVHRFPRDGGLRRDLAESCQRLGDWVRDGGDHESADALYRQALASWRRRATLDPADLGARLAQADLHDRLAELELAAGDRSGARRRWRRALAIAEEVCAEAPTEEHEDRVTRYRTRLG
ncbi:CHAT domain-containing protein [Micromonospora sp. NPDC049559]|uniref:CHAT domain-containing protein n=1 Tax=Micromonospora sp. NPDC049559 TaxID=3155923 RepID=UPI00341E2749